MVVSLVLLALLLVAPAAAIGAPPDRAAATEAYLDLRDLEQIPAGWTGSVEGCVQGVEGSASVDATGQAVNTLRDFAGLPPVAFDPELNRKALAAALMMRAAGALSHQPGPDWPCYTQDGDEAAGRSNLFLGSSGPAAMIGYVDDATVASLGHRRWVLDPRAGTFGTGSTGTTNALLVIGGPADPDPVIPELVTWPPAGHIPWPLVFEDWSAAISVPGSVDLSSATVAVSVDGQPRATSGVTVLEDGFGTGRTLRWNVELETSDREGAHDVAVRIDGVLIDGAPRQFSYTFAAFPVLPPAPPRFTGRREAGTVAVDWEPAPERGAPVTGYRILGRDGDSAPAFDRTVGPEVRSATIAYDRPRRTLDVQVVPLSRAGSPEVAPVRLPAPEPPAGSGGGTGPVGEDGGGVLLPIAAAARLRVRAKLFNRRRLMVRVRINTLANGGTVRLRVRGGGRTAVRRARIRRGRARFGLRLSARHRRARPLRFTVRYAGGRGVAAETSPVLVFRR